MLLEVSERDVLTSRVVEPAWYLVQIDDIEEKLAKDQQSTNAWIKGHIIKNADDGSDKNANVPTPYLWMINSKGAWSAIGLFEALGQEVKPKTRLNVDFLKGKQVEMFIGNQPDLNGTMRNSVTGQFRKVGSGKKQPSEPVKA